MGGRITEKVNKFSIRFLIETLFSFRWWAICACKSAPTLCVKILVEWCFLLNSSKLALCTSVDCLWMFEWEWMFNKDELNWFKQIAACSYSVIVNNFSFMTLLSVYLSGISCEKSCKRFFYLTHYCYC